MTHLDTLLLWERSDKRPSCFTRRGRGLPAKLCHLFLPPPEQVWETVCHRSCHRFMRKCSGRLEIMGKACFLYGPVLGCRMGSGAEASPHTVTSICSIPPVSIGYSMGVWGFVALAEGPRPQKSPGENFTGLQRQERSVNRVLLNGLHWLLSNSKKQKNQVWPLPSLAPVSQF